MIINGDCFEELKKLDSGSVDLIIIDPPYNISRNSNFKSYSEGTSKELVTKYAGISIDFGDWDKQDLNWDSLFYEYYRILKKSGTIVIFYDIWKSNEIKESAELNKFKQPRVGMWMKTNPVPINSKLNYLSNATEFFFTFVKGKKPTFHSVYDNGVYRYPICHGKERYDHPTQKPLALISDIINKHSNEGDVVLDNFAGTGTTAHACILNNRNYIVIERDDKYFDILKSRIDGLTTNLEVNNIK